MHAAQRTKLQNKNGTEHFQNKCACTGSYSRKHLGLQIAHNHFTRPHDLCSSAAVSKALLCELVKIRPVENGLRISGDFVTDLTYQ